MQVNTPSASICSQQCCNPVRSIAQLRQTHYLLTAFIPPYPPCPVMPAVRSLVLLCFLLQALLVFPCVQGVYGSLMPSLALNQQHSIRLGAMQAGMQCCAAAALSLTPLSGQLADCCRRRRKAPDWPRPWCGRGSACAAAV